MQQNPLVKAAHHRPTFVAPEPRAEIVPARIEILPPEPYQIDVPLPVTSSSQVSGTHLDRAHAFRVAVTPLCFVAGILGVIVAVAGVGVPLLSLAVLGWFFTWFGSVWLVGWLLTLVVSADGIALFQAWAVYRILRTEQRERINRYKGQHGCR